MSRRDFRCGLTGVSLLGAEAALVLIQKTGEIWHLSSLPLFGRYEGAGTLTEVSEGPNADLLLAFFKSAHASGQVVVDFEKMGLSEQPLDDLEMWLSLLACSQVGNHDACRYLEQPLGFCLFSAHVLAQLMGGEPEEPIGLSLEALPTAVLGPGFGPHVYQGLSSRSLKTRCKFALSFLGLLAAKQEMERREVALLPPGPGIFEDETEPARYLAEALVAFASSVELVEALEDYAGQFSDEEDVE